MNINGEPKNITNQAPSSNIERGVFKSISNEHGQFAVLSDYPNPDEILQSISANYESFFQDREQGIGGRRPKFYVNVQLSSGEAIKFLVKGKEVNESNEVMESLRKGKYPYVPQGKGWFDKYRRETMSVVAEVKIRDKAIKAYRKKYGQELLVEKPVGFYISAEKGHRGSRYVLFEVVDEIQYMNEDLLKQHDMFVYQIQSRLAACGIESDIGFQAIPVDDKDNPGSVKFTLVDLESWRDVNKGNL